MYLRDESVLVDALDHVSVELETLQEVVEQTCHNFLTHFIRLLAAVIFKEAHRLQTEHEKCGKNSLCGQVILLPGLAEKRWLT